MIIGPIDVGGRPAHVRAQMGQAVVAQIVLGQKSTAWSEGASLQKIDIEFHAWAWQPIGGQPAGSLAAQMMLRQQLRELASNPDLQPVFIQPRATSQPGWPSSTSIDDGWYFIDAMAWDPEDYLVGLGILPVTLTASKVAEPPPARLGIGWSAATMSTNFVGSSIPLQALLTAPPGSVTPSGYTRVGGEGSLSVFTALADPVLIQLPASPANWYKGGCHVFDTNGPNPVPATGFTNANWTEVFGPSHAFTGDAIITNGLLLTQLFSSGSNFGTLYWWNASGNGWQQVGSLRSDTFGAPDTPIGYTVEHLSGDEISVKTSAVLTGLFSGTLEFGLRLQRGATILRISETSYGISYVNSPNGLHFLPFATTKAIVWNSGAVADQSIDTVPTLAAQTDFGYCAIVFPNAATQYMMGLLWQNKPPSNQPSGSSGAGWYIAPTDGPVVNGTSYFGVWVGPMTPTQNMQAEAEGGTLDAGWSSVADGAASAGNTAKALSGTVSGRAGVFGTAWSPVGGYYDVWFRVRVTSAAGSAAEMTLGLWDPTAAAFVANGSTTFRANQAATTYTWLKASTGGPMGLPAAHDTRFRAVTAATIGTDWFVDEAVLVLQNQASIVNLIGGPVDFWKQFIADVNSSWVQL